jgi:hypothetical protein
VDPNVQCIAVLLTVPIKTDGNSNDTDTALAPMRDIVKIIGVPVSAPLIMGVMTYGDPPEPETLLLGFRVYVSPFDKFVIDPAAVVEIVTSPTTPIS